MKNLNKLKAYLEKTLLDFFGREIWLIYPLSVMFLLIITLSIVGMFVQSIKEKEKKAFYIYCLGRGYTQEDCKWQWKRDYAKCE